MIDTGYLGDAGDVLGIYGGIEQGGAAGETKAGLSTARLGAQTGIFGSESGLVNTAAGDLTNIAGIYTGIEQGGALGYTQAGANAAALGARSGAFGGASGAIGEAAGAVGAGISLYEFGKNWQSGATGSDALSGAEAGASTGAAVGSIVPGIGTAIGAIAGTVIGGVVGAVSSLFGPGKQDPETVNWDTYAQAFKQGGAGAVQGASPSQNFQLISGIFDARGSSLPFYSQFGRQGENQFSSAMFSQINEALAKGAIPANASPAQIYNQVVEPWINGMSPGGWQASNTAEGAPEKAAIGNLLTNFIGQWQAGEVNSSTPLGISGQTLAGGVPAYGAGGIGNAASSTQGSATPGDWHVPRNKGPATLQSSTGASMADANTTAAMGAASILPAALSGGSSGAGTTGGSTLSSLFSSPTAGDPLSGLGTYGLLGGIGLYGASQAQSNNQSIINPIAQAGQVFQGAGVGLLGQSLSGQLTLAQSQVVQTSQQQGQTLINAATPVGQIAQGLMKQYQSGQLQPADQTQLNQWVASAKAQAAQALGSNADSTTLATYYAQIDSQAQITKQQMLNSYLQTGNQEFDQWSTTTQAGQQAILAGQQYAVTQIDNTFQQALGASSLGSQNLLAGIQATLQSNQQVGNALQQYMSNLTTSYALSKALSGLGGTSSGGTSSSTSSPDPLSGATYDPYTGNPINTTTSSNLTPQQTGYESLVDPGSATSSSDATSYGYDSSNSPFVDSLGVTGP